MVLIAEDRVSPMLNNLTRRLKSFGGAVRNAGDDIRRGLSIVQNAAEQALGIGVYSAFDNIVRIISESVNVFVRFESSSVRLAALAKEAGQSINELALAFRVVASAASRELAVGVNEAMDSLKETTTSRNGLSAQVVSQ